MRSELTVARRAMACEFSIAFPAGIPNGVELGCAALDEIERLEDLLSVFRPDSEISRLNRGEGPVSDEVEQLLRWAGRIRAATHGAFDAAVGGRYNLGAIGKGFAIDSALRRIRPRAALMQGGQSSIAAVGSWPVAIGDPPFARIELRNRAMGTSGAQYQGAHIVDPRTGRPAASGILSATCLAPTATEADALSTAFYVMGAAATRRFCEANPRFGAILLLPGAAGLPRSDDERRVGLSGPPAGGRAVDAWRGDGRSSGPPAGEFARRVNVEARSWSRPAGRCRVAVFGNVEVVQ